MTTPARAREILEPELAPGERLLWVGQPNPHRLLDKSDFIAIPFSLYWNGFMAFFSAHVIESVMEGGRVFPDLLFVAWIGVPFLLIGLYLLIGRFFHRAWTKRRTWYGLTQHRAIAVREGRVWRSTNVGNLRALTNISAKVRRDGSGSVSFVRRSGWERWFSGSDTGMIGDDGDAPTFENIPDAARVVEILGTLRSGAGQRADWGMERPMRPVSTADRTLLHGLLMPGETVLWVGRPDPRKHLTPNDVFLVPFSVLWTGFAFLWLLSAIGLFGEIGESAPGRWPVGAAFVLFGAYFTVGRFAYKAFRKRRFVYGLIPGLALILDRGGPGAKGERVPLRTLASVSSSVRHDGTGSVTFGGSSDAYARPYANTGLEFFSRSRKVAPAFYDVPDARAVMKLVSGIWAEGASTGT